MVALFIGAPISALVVFHVDRPVPLLVALALLVPVAVAAERLPVRAGLGPGGVRPGPFNRGW